VEQVTDWCQMVFCYSQAGVHEEVSRLPQPTPAGDWGTHKGTDLGVSNGFVMMLVFPSSRWPLLLGREPADGAEVSTERANDTCSR
jgi:hypothetical protein